MFLNSHFLYLLLLCLIVIVLPILLISSSSLPFHFVKPIVVPSSNCHESPLFSVAFSHFRVTVSNKVSTTFTKLYHHSIFQPFQRHIQIVLFSVSANCRFIPRAITYLSQLLDNSSLDHHHVCPPSVSSWVSSIYACWQP